MSDLALLVLAWPLALVGCLFVVTGAIGLVRMPDLYTRLHASSLTDTGGTILIVASLLVHAVVEYAGSPLVAIKLVLVLVFTLYTAPTASHALAKTALLSGLVPAGRDREPLLDSPAAARRIARSRPEPDDGVDDPPERDRDGAGDDGRGGDPDEVEPVATDGRT